MNRVNLKITRENMERLIMATYGKEVDWWEIDFEGFIENYKNELKERNIYLDIIGE